MVSNFGVRQDSESLRLQGDQTSQPKRKSTLNTQRKDCCWGWSSNNLATCWEELTHWKRPGCRARLKAGGEREDRGWDGLMASLTQRTWAWASYERWWWTGKPGVLQSMESQSQTWLSDLTTTNFFFFWLLNLSWFENNIWLKFAHAKIKAYNATGDILHIF